MDYAAINLRKNMTLISRSYEVTDLSTEANATSCGLSFLQQAFSSSPAGLYHATQSGMSLQPTIDIPLIQMIGTEPPYENYEAMGTRQLS